MVFILPCSRWVYNDDMRYLTHCSQICCGRRTTLHGAIRGEKPRYDMQQSTMGTMIEWYHIFGLDWPYRDCMDTILIEDIKCTYDMHKICMLYHPTKQMMWEHLEGHYWGTRRLSKSSCNANYWILDCNVLVWTHNSMHRKCIWNHHITYVLQNNTNRNKIVAAYY